MQHKEDIQYKYNNLGFDVHVDLLDNIYANLIANGEISPEPDYDSIDNLNDYISDDDDIEPIYYFHLMQPDYWKDD